MISHETKGDLEDISLEGEVDETFPETLDLTSASSKEGISLAILTLYIARHGGLWQ